MRILKLFPFDGIGALCARLGLLSGLVIACGCGGGKVTLVTPQNSQLKVATSGSGSGSVTSSPSGINCGSTCSASFATTTQVSLTATAASGSTFAGWGGACSGTASCSVSMATDSSVTASFTTSTVPPVTLTVQTAGSGTGTVTSSPSGITCGSTCSANFPSGSQVTLTAAAGANSAFAGWSGACSGTGTCTVTLSAAASVTATFNSTAVPQVTLTVNTSGTGTGSVLGNSGAINCSAATCTYSVPKGTAITLSEAVGANSGFGGWSGACSGTNASCSVPMNANTTVGAAFTAVAQPVQIAVTLAGSGTGSVTSSPVGINCGSTCSNGFTAGSPVTLTAAPTSGSVFGGWSGVSGCSSATTCTVTPTSAAIAVTATFNPPPQYTLTIAPPTGAGTGTITSNDSNIACTETGGTATGTCNASYTSGATVTLTATAGANSAFSGWSGASCTGTAPCTVTMTQNQTVTAPFAAGQQLTVLEGGTGSGTVASTAAGVSCSSSPCTTVIPTGTSVTLTATPASGSTFTGWSGACRGTQTCTVKMSGAESVTATFYNGPGNINQIQHVILLVQENRSLDNYFGAMRQYWAANNIPDQSFDGLPQFNPSTGIAPLQGPVPTNPGCDPSQAFPASTTCVVDENVQVASFHFNTVCNENTSPSWNEAHVDWDWNDQVGKYPAKMNGFVRTAAHDARTNSTGGTNPLNGAGQHAFYDTDGIRAMGYWNGTDLNYYYYMGTQFATSDRFFQPAMSRTNINREYLTAATSGGYAYPNGTYPADTPQLKSTTIFQELDQAGISWKIYVQPEGTPCTQPYTQQCLGQNNSYLENFTYFQHVLDDPTQHIFPMSQYYADLQNGTLPQFAEIMPPSDESLDEHGADSDNFPNNVQAGANYVAGVINPLMQTAGTANDAWSSSAVLFTYDESGGMYDHVSPQPMPSPDGIPPSDLPTDSVCYSATGPTCDFTWTGYRIPFIVISPFARKNYVSHTVADSTAILKFVETRFGLPALNHRDAAQIDLTEFFDFNNPPWMSPPTPPSQTIYGNSPQNPHCYLDHLP